MKRVVCCLPILLLCFVACRFGHESRREGWTDALVLAAEADCVTLWTRRIPNAPGSMISHVCHCVTDRFSTTYSTEQLANPSPGQSESSKQLALACIRQAGLDLAKLPAKSPSADRAR